MLLADVDPQVVAIVSLVITTVGAVVVAWLQKQGKEREAAAVGALVDATHAAAKAVQAGALPKEAAVVAIKAAAEDWGAHDHPEILKVVQVLAGAVSPSGGAK